MIYKKSRINYYINLTIIIISFLCVIVSFYFYFNSVNDIKIIIQDDGKQILEFNDLCLLPGDSTEYFIEIFSKNNKQYEFNFSYVNENKILMNNLHLRIFINDYLFYNGKIKDINNPKNSTFTIDFLRKSNNLIKVEFYLPIDVGNELQNIDLSFDLELKFKQMVG